MAAAPEVKVNRSVPPPTGPAGARLPRRYSAAVSFLTAAFGFVERTEDRREPWGPLAVGDDGAVIVAERAVGGAHPKMDRVTTVIAGPRVVDVDVAFATPRETMALSVLKAPVKPRVWRAGTCTLVDLAGHRWQLAEAFADIAPEEFGCETHQPLAGVPGAQQQVTTGRSERWPLPTRYAGCRGSVRPPSRRGASARAASPPSPRRW